MSEERTQLPRNRRPTHPGEILRYEFLEPLEMSQQTLADRIHVPYQRVNAIVNGRRRVSPSTALRLSKLFGTTPQFWMNLQNAHDLWALPC